MSQKIKSTVCEMKVASVKKAKSYNTEHPHSFEIEFEVPYDQNSIFYQKSGGSRPVLNTINEAVVKCWKLGRKW